MVQSGSTITTIPVVSLLVRTNSWLVFHLEQKLSLFHPVCWQNQARLCASTNTLTAMQNTEQEYKCSDETPLC